MPQRVARHNIALHTPSCRPEKLPNVCVDLCISLELLSGWLLVFEKLPRMSGELHGVRSEIPTSPRVVDSNDFSSKL